MAPPIRQGSNDESSNPVLLRRSVRKSKEGKKEQENILVDDSRIPRKEHLFSFPPSVAEWLVNHALYKQNRNNLYLVYTFFNMMMTTVPAAMLLFYFADGSWTNWRIHLVGLAYTVTNLLVWCKSFILCMHYSTHTPVFHRKGFWGTLNHVMPYGLCAFFGILPGQYFLHHIVMHHKEENIMPYDLSSTMQYNRGSRLHMMHYVCRYLFGIYFELPYYAYKRGRYDLCQKSISMVVISAFTYYMLCSWKPIATLYVFLFPLVFIAYGLMEGNWSQHIFVAPNVRSVPDDEICYAITYSCVESKNNSYTFNDGYHVEHHAFPTLAWYELPDKFKEMQYEKHDGIAFRTLDIDAVRELVFSGQFEKLASFYINYRNRTVPEIVSLLQSRLQPIA